MIALRWACFYLCNLFGFENADPVIIPEMASNTGRPSMGLRIIGSRRIPDWRRDSALLNDLRFGCNGELIKARIIGGPTRRGDFDHA